jgi:MerR family transcriptional regulator, light-induced transcriptional regulator
MMRDSQHDGQTDHGGNGVSFLAKTVVARLAARDLVLKPNGEHKLEDSILVALTEALVNPDSAAFDATKPLLKRARVSTTELADLYFPAVARRLGRDWEEDRRSFADVTIGVARMQSVLRDIGADWASEDGEQPRLGAVLVILPDGEQHSFGAMVLTGQLRRRGVSVRLHLGPSEAELRALLRERRFDGALVSVGSPDRLALCRKLVKTLKGETGGALRVAVGGCLRTDGLDVASATGADMVTNDLSEVLVALGLTQSGARAE